MQQYQITKSNTQLNGWVLTDTTNLVVLRFEDGKYNDTNKITILDDSELMKLEPAEIANKAAKIIQAMGDYVVRYHSSKAFDMPHGFEYDEDSEKLFLYRRTYPRLRVEILEDGVQGKELKDALKKMASFVMNNKRY